MLIEEDLILLKDIFDLYFEIDIWNSELKNCGEFDNYFYRGKIDGVK